MAKKENKYLIGRDEYNNSIFDYEKVFKDIKKIFNPKKECKKNPITDDMYNVMMLRFTIAHYDKFGWLMSYNKNWKILGDEIFNHARFEDKNPTKNVLPKIITFLRENNNKDITFP